MFYSSLILSPTVLRAFHSISLRENHCTQIINIYIYIGHQLPLSVALNYFFHSYSYRIIMSIILRDRLTVVWIFMSSHCRPHTSLVFSVTFCSATLQISLSSFLSIVFFYSFSFFLFVRLWCPYCRRLLPISISMCEFLEIIFMFLAFIPHN